MTLFLVRRGARRFFSRVHGNPSVPFESLYCENKTLLSAPVVTQRVLEYLLVNHKDVQRVLSTEKGRPLSYKALLAPQQVHRLTPLVQWGFQQLKDNSHAADAVFSTLEPHANMTRGVVWQQYFLRQFFLSGAPLRSYLLAYKSHRDARGATREHVAVKEDEADKDEDEAQEEKGGENVVTGSTWTPNKEWEWVPVYVAFNIVKEFCFRGRFAEALEAYALLPLTDTARCQVVTILQYYEQYPSVLCLYEVHRTMGDAVTPLDVAPELNALQKVGRVDAMARRFQELPAKDQSRADIQELMGN